MNALLATLQSISGNLRALLIAGLLVFAAAEVAAQAATPLFTAPPGGAAADVRLAAKRATDKPYIARQRAVGIDLRQIAAAGRPQQARAVGRPVRRRRAAGRPRPHRHSQRTELLVVRQRSRPAEQPRDPHDRQRHPGRQPDRPRRLEPGQGQLPDPVRGRRALRARGIEPDGLSRRPSARDRPAPADSAGPARPVVAAGLAEGQRHRHHRRDGRLQQRDRLGRRQRDRCPDPGGDRLGQHDLRQQRRQRTPAARLLRAGQLRAQRQLQHRSQPPDRHQRRLHGRRARAARRLRCRHGEPLGRGRAVLRHRLGRAVRVVRVHRRQPRLRDRQHELRPRARPQHGRAARPVRGPQPQPVRVRPRPHQPRRRAGAR